jgi:hypothetical protein
MPIDLTKIPDHLKEAAAAGNLVPFIGAGISRQAKIKGARLLPTWSEFMADLMNIARDEGLNKEEEKQIDELVKQGKFLMAAQALKDEIDPAKLEHFIRTRFISIGAEPGPIHYSLFKLRPHIIMTTNYDVLLEKAYIKKVGKDVQPITPENSHIVQQVLKGYQEWDRPLIFKIHGTAREPDKVVFAERDYRSLIYGTPGYRAVISAVFVTKVVLMLGFSNSDPEVTMVLQTLREGFRERSSPDYIVLRKGIKGTVEKKRLSQDFGLEVIEYEPSDGDSELLQLVDYLAQFVPRKIRPRSVDTLRRSPIDSTG